MNWWGIFVGTTNAEALDVLIWLNGARQERKLKEREEDVEFSFKEETTFGAAAVNFLVITEGLARNALGLVKVLGERIDFVKEDARIFFRENKRKVLKKVSKSQLGNETKFECFKKTKKFFF